MAAETSYRVTSNERSEERVTRNTGWSLQMGGDCIETLSPGWKKCRRGNIQKLVECTGCFKSGALP